MDQAKRIQQLDLNLLKVFQTLYVEQNMTRAAEALHITPSAVSHAITRLRDALGDPLFKRRQNKMLPTPMCQRMAPLIIDNLMRLQQSLQQWDEFDPLNSKQHFKIGMHDGLEPTIIPRLSSLLSEQAPNVSYSSIKIDRPNLARELDAGHIDLAIDIALPMRSPVNHVPLLECEFSVIMRKGHPLENSLNLTNYLSAMHLTVSNRATGMTAEDILFHERGHVRNSNTRCQNYFAARELIKHSDLLLTLPKLMGVHLLDHELSLNTTPIDLPLFSCHLYWHKHTEQDASLTWLRTLFCEQINLLN